MWRFILRPKSKIGLLKELRLSYSHLTKLKESNIIQSTSQDIYSNLAFEDWLYKNLTLSNDERKIIFWKNNPAVVIGRHQNPWSECNWNQLDSLGVKLARRNSGGGTVYHDIGNINICFMTSNKSYNRKKNLEIISCALKKHWNINAIITPREDLTVNNKKVSGTAAKLSQKNSYHHCTLLLDVDMRILHSVLHKNTDHIESNATESIRSEILNLNLLAQGIDCNSIIEAVSSEFLDQFSLKKNAVSVNPDVLNLNDFEQVKTDLMSWDWIFGKTPKFVVKKDFEFQNEKISLTISVYHGLIQEIKFSPAVFSQGHIDIFIGKRYKTEDVQRIYQESRSKLEHLSHLVYFITQTINST